MGTRTFILFCAVACLFFACACVSASESFAYNERPIIAVMAHPDYALMDQYPSRQYIAASYIKWIESAGGRAVPFPANINQHDAEILLSQVNGLLFPGGGMDYPEVAGKMLDYAIAMNDKGIHFPVWGTCLGHEWLSTYFGATLSRMDSENIALPLRFTNRAPDTTLFNALSQELITILGDADHPVTMNNHNWGVTTADFQKYGLDNHLNLISVSYDRNNLEFVSMMQHKKYPIFGSQWHPEKNAFEWGVNANGTAAEVIPHSLEAVFACQWMANYFIHEARKNANKFDDWKIEQSLLSYNYAKFRGNSDSFVEKYWFDSWQTGSFVTKV